MITFPNEDRRTVWASVGSSASFQKRFAVGILLARRIVNSCSHRMRMTANRTVRTRANGKITRIRTRTRGSAILGTVIRPGKALGDDLDRCNSIDRWMYE